LEGFGVTLKTILGLARPKQHYQAIMRKFGASFRVIFLAGKAQFFMIPNMQYYCLLYDNFKFDYGSAAGTFWL